MAASKAALHGLCLLGSLLCLLSSPAMAASEPDFLYLTLMWPGGYCKKQTCCLPTTGKPAADFLVQALETYDSVTGNSVTNCSSPCRFHINPLRKLIDDMYAYWPSLDCPSNNGMQQWSDVWCTYGTCSNLTQLDYFNRTLRLREKVDVLTVLGSKGIVPSASESYSLEDIEGALVPQIGFSAVVECTRKYILWPVVYDDYLSGIRICVSSDGTAVIGCPLSRKSSCGDTVKFPPISLYASAAGSREADAAAVTANPIKLPSDEDVIM